MAQWRAFGATGEPGTCLWCGRKLHFKTSWTGEYETYTRDGTEYRRMVTVRNEKPGDYGDGYFCGLRCAYSFGERMAQLGRRLRA